MESYKSYFDRQTVSPELHEKLLAIGRQPRTERRRRPFSPAWKKWAALAACCALALGLGLWRLSAPGETGSGACVPPAVSSSAGGFLFPQRGEPGIRLSGGRF